MLSAREQPNNYCVKWHWSVYAIFFRFCRREGLFVCGGRKVRSTECLLQTKSPSRKYGRGENLKSIMQKNLNAAQKPLRGALRLARRR
jgi:hypothetical protein